MEFIKYEYPKESHNGQLWERAQPECEVLRCRREELGLTQQQVADKAGIQLRQYQRLESGERNIIGASMRVGLSVCAVLKLNPYMFLGYSV